MLRLSGTYDQMHNSIHSSNIPDKWTYNLDYTMLLLLNAMLSRYISNTKKYDILDNEDEVVEVRDRIRQILKWKTEEKPWFTGDKEKEDYLVETFTKLGKILETLVW